VQELARSQQMLMQKIGQIEQAHQTLLKLATDRRFIEGIIAQSGVDPHQPVDTQQRDSANKGVLGNILELLRFWSEQQAQNAMQAPPPGGPMPNVPPPDPSASLKSALGTLMEVNQAIIEMQKSFAEGLRYVRGQPSSSDVSEFQKTRDEVRQLREALAHLFKKPRK